VSERPPVTLVVARATNGVIGRQGTLPWHIPADLKRFKALTMGTVTVMGRRTFESLPGLLPNRRHIVLTRERGWNAAGAEVAHSVDEALALAGKDRISVIGGEAEGETAMADPRKSGHWRETYRADLPPEADRPAFRFLTLERA
jgi:dihydrofolate reductase